MDILVACKVQWHLKGMLWEYFFRVYEIDEFISENFRKLYDADLANDIHCYFPPEALMKFLVMRPPIG